MTAELLALSWPASRLGEALDALARQAGFPLRQPDLPAPPPCLVADPTSLGSWLEGAARWRGLEAEPVDYPWVDLEQVLPALGPALVMVPRPKTDQPAPAAAGKPAQQTGPAGLEPLVVALVRGRGGKLQLVSPEGGTVWIALELLGEALCGAREAAASQPLTSVLEAAGVPPRRQQVVRRAMLRQVAGQLQLGPCWLLRLPPSAPFLDQVRHAQLGRSLAAFVMAQVAHVGLTLGAWVMIGRGALEGRLDPWWLAAWVLLLLSTVPAEWVMEWSRGVFSIGVGQLLKRRLLVGALRLRTREIRLQGSGQLLGRVVESSAVGSLALSAALSAVVSLVELVAAAWVLSQGAGGGWHSLLLLLWIAVALGLGVHFFRQFQAWTHCRLDLTHDLVERMVGHRTRLAQQAPSRWHQGEDEGLAEYLHLSERVDRWQVFLSLCLTRGWLVVGLVGLLPAFARGAGLAALAVGLGGVLLAGQAMAGLTSTVALVTAAAVAWRQARPLFNAARREQRGILPLLAGPPAPGQGVHGETVVEADRLVFRYRDRGEPVLRGTSLRIGRGDRLLLEGPSGGGKSTLVSILAGWRQPESGLVLLRGLDWHTMGRAGWRQLVATAPQFQENHVLTGTLAFNLLMGREWPASDEDLQEAETTCRALGLGPLLDRMPSGMLQIVGETGWRLSHGERSRVFIARALLQRAELVVLDESFAALDPESLARALRCVLDRAPTLLVVAHP